MFRFFLETRWPQFREGSVVCRQLSYRIDRMAIVRCRFVFLGLHFDCQDRFPLGDFFRAKRLFLLSCELSDWS